MIWSKVNGNESDINIHDKNIFHTMMRWLSRQEEEEL